MDKTELLATIAQATREGWTKLNLSGKGLTELPPEFGQLTTLVELNLSANQLTSLPSQIGQLTNLTTLYLSRNRLTTLPSQIGQLANLIALDLTTEFRIKNGTIAGMLEACDLKEHPSSYKSAVNALSSY